MWYQEEEPVIMVVMNWKESDHHKNWKKVVKMISVN
jgi:hypothetical protein